MKWPHVIAVGDAIVLIKAVGGGQEFRVMTEVPFAEHCRCVTFRFANLGQRRFRIANANFGFWPKCPRDADAAVVTARHQSGSRCGANRG